MFTPCQLKTDPSIERTVFRDQEAVREAYRDEGEEFREDQICCGEAKLLFQATVYHRWYIEFSLCRRRHVLTLSRSNIRRPDYRRG